MVKGETVPVRLNATESYGQTNFLQISNHAKDSQGMRATHVAAQMV